MLSKLLFGLFAQIVAVQAIWYDNDGVPVSNGLITSPNLQFTTIIFNESRQPAPFNGTFMIFGFADGGTCAASLIKTWKGDAPPSDLDAVAISSGRCISSMNRAITDGKILVSLPVTKTDGNSNTLGDAIFKNYLQNKGIESKILRRQMKTIEFAVSNLIDISVISLNMKAIDFYNQGYTFYKLSNQPIAANSTINNIGFFDSSFTSYFMRSMRGTVTSLNSTYKPKFGRQVTHSFIHNSNVFSTGGPVFSPTDNTTIIGIVTEGGVSANYGMDVSGIAECFNAVGKFSLNTPNCLVKFKLDFRETFKETLDGFRYIPKDEASNNSTGSFVNDFSDIAGSGGNAAGNQNQDNIQDIIPLRSSAVPMNHFFMVSISLTVLSIWMSISI